VALLPASKVRKARKVGKALPARRDHRAGKDHRDHLVPPVPKDLPRHESYVQTAH
jgi:hypothetical protein